MGETAGALDAAKLYGNYTGDTNVAGGAGAGLGLLGVYSGISQGGAAGDLQAGMGSAQLAGEAANAGYLGSSSVASTLGTLGSTAAAVAPIVGLAAYAVQTPPYTISPSKYAPRVQNTFDDMLSGGINGPNFMSDYDELINGGQQEDMGGTPSSYLNAADQQQMQQMYQQYLAQRGISTAPQPVLTGGSARGSGPGNPSKRTNVE